MIEGSATTTIERPVEDVFAAVADITRMGEWSPECIAARWIAPATGPAVGARFEGDNIARLGPITLKRWTTTSEVTEFVPGEVFEFVAEGYTTWRYEFEAVDGVTRLTETYRHAPYEGLQAFMYDTVARRPASMVRGMQETLARIKQSLEA